MSYQETSCCSNSSTFRQAMPSPPVGVLTVVAWCETGLDKFLSPNFLSCSSWIPPVGFVSFREISVNRCPAILNRSVVAIVENRFCHDAEHGLNNIEELGRRGEGHQCHDGC